MAIANAMQRPTSRQSFWANVYTMERRCRRIPCNLQRVVIMAILQKWVPYSQRYLVVGLGLPLLYRLGLVGLALWLVSGEGRDIRHVLVQSDANVSQ